MSVEVTERTRWDDLHSQPRFRPVYPSEHVVRFLASLGPADNRTALDVGCGAGRHSKLLADYGFTTYPCDSSEEALTHVQELLSGHPNVAPAVYADMLDLPFKDHSFDVAVAYGVFYYADERAGMEAIAEFHRVLKTGGRGFVKVRTPKDWRASKVGPGGCLVVPGEPEDGQPMHFQREDGIFRAYDWFRTVRWELAETTTHNRLRLNSDWLITVTK